MKNDRLGFSVIFSMVFVVFISLLVIYILELILPFSRDTKWVENSSASYYEAMKWIEDSLFFAKENELTDRWEFPTSGPYTSVLVANTNDEHKSLPATGEWNSDYDKDFNIINTWNPVQLEIWNGLIGNWGDVKLEIQAPDIDGDGSYSNNLTLGTGVIINWQLTSATDTYSASSGSYISANNIIFNKLINDTSWWNKIKGLAWMKLDGSIPSPNRLSEFYQNECLAWNKCSLKFSVVNELNNGPIKVPYLEWKLDFNTSWSTNIVPTRFYRITSVWNTWAFRKILEVQRPQQTVIQAFDFTVIQ